MCKSREVEAERNEAESLIQGTARQTFYAKVSINQAIRLYMKWQASHYYESIIWRIGLEIGIHRS